MQYISEQPLHVSFNNLVNNIGKHVEASKHTSLKEKIFLPKHYATSPFDMLATVFHSSFLSLFRSKPKKEVIVYDIEVGEGLGYNPYSSFRMYDIFETCSDMEKLTISHFSFTSDPYYLMENLHKSSPNLRELIIFSRTGETVIYPVFWRECALARFDHLKRLVIENVFQEEQLMQSLPANEFNFPESLEVFEYNALNEDLVQQYIVPRFPNVKFVPIFKGNGEKYVETVDIPYV